MMPFYEDYRYTEEPMGTYTDPANERTDAQKKAIEDLEAALTAAQEAGLVLGVYHMEQNPNGDPVILCVSNQNEWDESGCLSPLEEGVTDVQEWDE